MYFVREEIDRRTENSKTFLRSYGILVMKSLSDTIHYYDEEKEEYIEIDNTLEEAIGATGEALDVNHLFKDQEYELILKLPSALIQAVLVIADNNFISLYQ